MIPYMRTRSALDHSDCMGNAVQYFQLLMSGFSAQFFVQ